MPHKRESLNPRYQKNRMNTYHFYKTNCFKASRLMMQAGLDANPVFVHRPEQYAENQSAQAMISSIRLSYWSLLNIFYKERDTGATFIFHAQSSLPYLLTCVFFTYLMRSKKVQLIYDIHDLHEVKWLASIWHRFRYSLIRGGLLGLMERIVFQLSSIKKMTVSNGLARMMAEKYAAEKPSLVRNISYFNEELDLSTKNFENRLVYFGQKDRAPMQEFLDSVIKNQLSIHLHGRGVPELNGGQHMFSRFGESSIQYYGAYSPDDLSFLREYDVLILWRPDDCSLNYRFSLPNKVFQAMWFGMSVIVSENFEEISELFKDVSGAVYILRDPLELPVCLSELCQLRGSDYIKRIQFFLQSLHEDNESLYLNLTAIKD